MYLRAATPYVARRLGSSIDHSSCPDRTFGATSAAVGPILENKSRRGTNELLRCWSSEEISDIGTQLWGPIDDAHNADAQELAIAILACALLVVPEKWAIAVGWPLVTPGAEARDNAAPHLQQSATPAVQDASVIT